LLKGCGKWRKAYLKALGKGCNFLNKEEDKKDINRRLRYENREDIEAKFGVGKETKRILMFGNFTKKKVRGIPEISNFSCFHRALKTPLKIEKPSIWLSMNLRQQDELLSLLISFPCLLTSLRVSVIIKSFTENQNFHRKNNSWKSF
jgi:hypothetical protein